jgi:ABC-type uncharacterized transport system substrate-binding protein
MQNLFRFSSKCHTLPADRTVIVAVAPGVTADLCADGMLEGFRQSGITARKNLEVVHVGAQGKMIHIPANLQNYDNSDVDVIMTISTPCLSGAFSKVKNKPVTLSCVSDPIAAGAGTNPTESTRAAAARRQAEIFANAENGRRGSRC